MSIRKRIVRLIVFILLSAIFIPAGEKDVADAASAGPVNVSGGYAHGLAVWSDGTVTGWGYNKYGQVGDGTTIDQYIPKKIAGLTDIVQTAAGSNASFALDKNGEVWAWGQTYSAYVLDDPVLPYQKSGGPVKLAGLQDVTSITTDGSSGIAVKSDGTAVLWYPSFEQSDVTMQMKVRYLPLQGISGVRSAVIAGNDALFLTDTGSVIRLSIYNSVMGRNRWASDPVTVYTLAASAIKQIAASSDDAFLLRTDGQVLRWNNSLKEPVASGFGNVYKLQTGYRQLFMLKTNGTLWQWNYNSGPLSKAFQVKGAEGITNLWGSTGSFGFAQRKDGTLLGWGEGYYSGLAAGSGNVAKDGAVAAVPVQPPLNFLVNGQPVSFYGTAGVIDGKLYVPYTSVFKALGVKAGRSMSNPDPKVNNNRYTVWSFVYGSTTVQIKASVPEQIFINGRKSERTISLKSLSESTQFPLQELCDSLGISLQWNKTSGEAGV